MWLYRTILQENTVGLPFFALFWYFNGNKCNVWIKCRLYIQEVSRTQDICSFCGNLRFCYTFLWLHVHERNCFFFRMWVNMFKTPGMSTSFKDILSIYFLKMDIYFKYMLFLGQITGMLCYYFLIIVIWLFIIFYSIAPHPIL